MSTFADPLASIAVAKYLCFAKNTSDVKENFKKSISSYDKFSNNYPEFEYAITADIDMLLHLKRVGKFYLKEIKQYETSGMMSASIVDYVMTTMSDYEVDQIHMVVEYSQQYSCYEITATSKPLLITKFDLTDGKHKFETIQIDLAFMECAKILNDIFIGSMGCRRLVEPHPKRVRPNIHNILFNLSKTRTPLTDRIKEALKGATKDILISGWIGRAIIPDLKKCRELGVDIKIVTHRPQEAEGTKGSSDKREAFEELQKFVDLENVRILHSCHARMVIVDEQIVFVGSMDLDSASLSERDEAAIMSEDIDIIARSRYLFQELFSKGTKLKSRV